MKNIKILSIALLSGLLLNACVEKRPDVEEKLGSFDIRIDYSKSPVPGDAYVTCTFGEQTDLCPGAGGTLEKPISFPAEQWAQVRVNIVAVGSKGTKPWPLTAPIALTLHQGTMFGQSRQVVLTDGKADNVMVRFKNTPGKVYIWAEDSLDRYDEKDGEPVFATGATKEALIFDQPSIPEIQKTDDECCSGLDGQRVKIQRGEVYISRMFGTTFNLQDVSAPEWGGLFVFSFRAIEGVRVGTHLLSIAGAVTEFQGGTQMTGPKMVAVHNLCGEESETIGENAVVKVCPPESECKEWSDGRTRCMVPNSDLYDRHGRRPCENDDVCTAGTSCQLIEDLAGDDGQKYCQVDALPASESAFPNNRIEQATFCGPTRTTAFTNENGDLTSELIEGSLVKLSAANSDGLRLSGLPVCKLPEGDDPLHSVRSTCNLADANGNPVDLVDCTLAVSGDKILRDEAGAVCFRGNQACKAIAGQNGYLTVNSTCNTDRSKGFCDAALPGEPVLKDNNGQICRGTMDDFIMGGYNEFAQSKVVFEVGERRYCATINFDALLEFDPFKSQEEDVRWQSITGTLRQVRFNSGTSFWSLDVRYKEDLELLAIEEN